MSVLSAETLSRTSGDPRERKPGWLTVWLVTWYWELKGEIDCSFIKLSVSSLAPARPPSKPSEGINYQFISQLGFLCVQTGSEESNYIHPSRYYRNVKHFKWQPNCWEDSKGVKRFCLWSVGINRVDSFPWPGRLMVSCLLVTVERWLMACQGKCLGISNIRTWVTLWLV